MLSGPHVPQSIRTCSRSCARSSAWTSRTSRVIDAPVGWLWRFGPDGRAVYGRVYESRREALEAAGLQAGG